MFQRIENLIKSFLGFISRVVKDLGKYSAPSSKPVEAVVSATQEPAPDEFPVIPEHPPLQVIVPIILVECTSCGSQGELASICQNCHRPVCSRKFCEKEVYREELGIRVIHCRNCAPAA
jgi:hypothetical protein